MADAPQFNFYFPLTFENELEVYRSARQNYVLDFRVKPGYPESYIKQMASYMYESIPFTKVSVPGSDYPTFFNNKVMATTLPRRRNTGQIIQHRWNNAGYQAIYSDYIVECLQRPHEGKTRGATVVVTSSLYVKIQKRSSGWADIVGYSPLLEKLIQEWKDKNDQRTPQDSDFFGTSSIKGYALELDQSTELTTVNQGSSATVSIVGNSVHFDSYVGDILPIVPIFAGSTSEIEWPVIGWEVASHSIGNRLTSLEFYTQGGSKTYNSVQQDEKELKVNTKTQDGPLTGTATPRWVVTATFHDGRKATAAVEDSGSWTIDYPHFETPLSPEDLDAIRVVQSNGVFSYETTTEIPPVRQTNLGLNILKDVTNNAPGQRYGGTYVNSIQTLEQYHFTYAGGSALTRRNTRYSSGLQSRGGVYFGRNPRSYNFNKHFMSVPGSVCSEGGIEIWSASAEGTIQGMGVTNYPNLSSSDFKPVVAVSAGPEEIPAQTKSIAVRYNITYPIEYSKRLKIRYRIKYDPVQVLYKFKYTTNVDLVDLKKRLSIAWKRDLLSTYTTEYLIRYQLKLPEERDFRKFFSFSYRMDRTKESGQRLRLAYTVEKAKSKRKQLKISYQVVLSDRTVIRPFYLKKYHADTSSYTDAIVFVVYADMTYMNPYTVNNQVNFYFSNPPKYELIKFDYNMLPYYDIFISTSDDPVFENRDEVPSRYEKLGVYIIDNINVKNSLSLDVMADTIQTNEYRSFWLPDDLHNYENSMITLADGKSKTLPLNYTFRDDHHKDVVELDLVILSSSECCFTQKAVGSVCSPY